MDSLCRALRSDNQIRGVSNYPPVGGVVVEVAVEQPAMLLDMVGPVSSLVLVGGMQVAASAAMQER